MTITQIQFIIAYALTANLLVFYFNNNWVSHTKSNL